MSDLKLAVCVLAIRENGDVLAVTRKNDHSKWGLPGGKVEDSVPRASGEIPSVFDLTLEAARELHEETGCLAKMLKLFYVADDTVGYMTFCFRAYGLDEPLGRTIDPGEGLCAWVGWDKLLSGPFGHYNRAVKSLVDAQWMKNPGDTNE